MNTDRLSYLLKQYLDNNLGTDEQEELDRLLQEGNYSRQLEDALETFIGQEQGLPDYQPAEWEPLFQKIRARATRPAMIRSITRKRLTAAAALLLLCLSGWLLYNKLPAKAHLAAASPTRPPAHDITPGSNKATLTLADNTSIDLDAAQDGVLAQQGNSQLIKNNNGQLTYKLARQGTTAPTYNLLTTPRGGFFQLLLPDGSKVWLNAASTLRYPTSFTGKDRVVELQGEAYFEIAHNPAMPFKVSVLPQQGRDHGEVEVLGTHFNIKAYADEPAIHTTLLEGSVRVHKGGAVATLHPGQEAQWNSSTDIKTRSADLEEAVAWKNGLFRFNEATIEDVMRQIARWYDVDVVYTNGIPRDLFRGEIYRNVNVSKVLKVLEASGVHFTVEGKKILVQ